MRRVFAALLFPAALACGEKTELEPEPVPMQQPPTMTVEYEKAMVTEARVQYPRFIDVEKTVIARTCSPNPGVCHQTNNYPDMRTAGSVLAMIGARCNIEIPDPKQGWDGCEIKGDQILLGEVAKEIGSLEKSGADWRVILREAAAETMTTPLELVTADQELLFTPPEEWNVDVELTQGSNEAVIKTDDSDPYIVDFVDSILKTAAGGDTNQNGIYGADDPSKAGALIFAGSTAKSYLWGRITGTVPGSRMPLANQPLSNAEYVALACWIEQLDPDGEPSALDTIDYDACAYAKAPIEYSAF